MCLLVIILLDFISLWGELLWITVFDTICIGVDGNGGLTLLIEVLLRTTPFLIIFNGRGGPFTCMTYRMGVPMDDPVGVIVANYADY